MPFNTPLPARGTDPWYDALVVGFIGGLRTFVNNLETLVNGKADASALGEPGGLASLDEDGRIQTSQIPVYLSESELTASFVQFRNFDGSAVAAGSVVVVTLTEDGTDIHDITVEEA